MLVKIFEDVQIGISAYSNVTKSSGYDVFMPINSTQCIAEKRSEVEKYVTLHMVYWLYFPLFQT